LVVDSNDNSQKIIGRLKGEIESITAIFDESGICIPNVNVIEIGSVGVL